MGELGQNCAQFSTHRNGWLIKCNNKRPLCRADRSNSSTFLLMKERTDSCGLTWRERKQTWLTGLSPVSLSSCPRCTRMKKHSALQSLTDNASVAGGKYTRTCEHPRTHAHQHLGISSPTNPTSHTRTRTSRGTTHTYPSSTPKPTPKQKMRGSHINIH